MTGDVSTLLAMWHLGRLTPMPLQLPKNWELVRLADVARLESGHTPSRRRKEYWNGDIPWVSLHDSDGLDDAEISSTALNITKAGLDNSSARLLPEGTVVFSRTATVGKATILSRAMATSQDFANYTCGNRLHNRYLMHLFRFMKPEWQRLMAGSTHNTIYMPIFERLQILLPPLCEQVGIARALSDVDALNDSLEQLAAKKRDIKQGALQALLTGRMRLRGFSKRWVGAKFGDVAFPRKDRAEPLDTSTFSVELEDIEQGTGRICAPAERRTSLSLKTSFRPGDVLFGKLRAYLRKYWLADRPGVCSTEIWALVAKPQVLPRYLLQVVQMATFIDAASTSYGTHMPRSDWQVVKNYELLLPPQPEQEAIADLLGALDQEIFAIDQQRAKLHRIKEGMMQELLTGRIRLVDVKPAEDLELVHSA